MSFVVMRRGQEAIPESLSGLGIDSGSPGCSFTHRYEMAVIISRGDGCGVEVSDFQRNVITVYLRKRRENPSNKDIALI